MPRPIRLVKLTVLVPAESKRALQRLARAKAWSVGTYVRFMLLAHLETAQAAGGTRDATRKAEEDPGDRSA